jgi:sulfur carrier protein
MMTIWVNNKLVELVSSENITAVLQRLQIDYTTGLAVAVNNEVIPKSTWETHILNEHDKVTIIRATQGG